MPTATFDAVFHTTALAAVPDDGTFVGIPSASPATPDRGIDNSIVSVTPDNAQLTTLSPKRSPASSNYESRPASPYPKPRPPTTTDGQRDHRLLSP